MDPGYNIGSFGTRNWIIKVVPFFSVRYNTGRDWGVPLQFCWFCHGNVEVSERVLLLARLFGPTSGFFGCCRREYLTLWSLLLFLSLRHGADLCRFRVVLIAGIHCILKRVEWTDCRLLYWRHLCVLWYNVKSWDITPYSGYYEKVTSIKIERGPLKTKNFRKKSHSAEKNWKGDALVLSGSVCYV